MLSQEFKEKLFIGILIALLIIMLIIVLGAFVMAYSAPAYNAINIELCPSYTAPAYNAINIVLNTTDACAGVAPTDTCTYSSGNWVVKCSDNCVIVSNVNVGGNNVIINGTGAFTVIGGNITNYKEAYAYGACNIGRYNGGSF